MPVHINVRTITQCIILFTEGQFVNSFIKKIHFVHILFTIFEE